MLVRLLTVLSAFALCGLQGGDPAPRHDADDDPERIRDAEAHQPVLVTDRTRADAKALALLETPGTILFSDGFESDESLKAYFEIRGVKEGHARLTTDAKLAHGGHGALQLTSVANDGKSSGAGASFWFGPDGQDRVYFRRYLRFAGDYDQGDLNHTGGGLSGVAGNDKWGGMGTAGLRPKGDDGFSASFETWVDWKRVAPPGYLFLYTYWPDMKRDKDGHFWGNMLAPIEKDRIVPERERWYCLEQMIRANTPGKADGEMATWVDGKLYEHWQGLRWRTSDAVKLKRFELSVYVHHATHDNTVWYDDVVLSTGYIGPATAR